MEISDLERELVVAEQRACSIKRMGLLGFVIVSPILGSMSGAVSGAIGGALSSAASGNLKDIAIGVVVGGSLGCTIGLLSAEELASEERANAYGRLSDLKEKYMQMFNREYQSRYL